MAARRMFARSVVGADRFLDLDSDTKCLYFALLGAADDDGFVDGVRGLARSWGLNSGGAEVLEREGYLLRFGDVLLIVHWHQHNCIPKDRYRPSIYNHLLSQVFLNDQREYTMLEKVEKSSENTLYTQDRTEETRTIQHNINLPRTHERASGAMVPGQALADADWQLSQVMGVAPSLQRQAIQRQLDAISSRIVSGKPDPGDVEDYRRLFAELGKTY